MVRCHDMAPPFTFLHVYGHQCAVMRTGGQLFDHFLYGEHEQGCFVLMSKREGLKRQAYYRGLRRREGKIEEDRIEKLGFLFS